MIGPFGKKVQLVVDPSVPVAPPNFKGEPMMFGPVKYHLLIYGILFSDFGFT